MIIGLRSQHKNRQTGTIVSVVDGIAAGYDTSGGRWQVICEDHGCICSFERIADAVRFAPVPAEFCEDCQLIHDRNSFI
jgi:hypothetical protein